MKQIHGIDMEFLNADLQKTTQLQTDFPSILFGDHKQRLCIHITTPAGSENAIHLLEKFFDPNMDREYDRTIIFVLSKKRSFTAPAPMKNELPFDPAKSAESTRS